MVNVQSIKLKTMAKSIKNYTSSIPAAQSMARIEEMLVAAGARDIRKQYDGFGLCISFVFILPIKGMESPLFFKLPAKVEKCREALWQQYLKTGNKGKPIKTATAEARITIQNQAMRTAWKIMHDLVEMQLTLIELDQLEPMEAFLPYLYNDSTGQTFYEHAKGTGFKQLTDN